MYDGPHVAHLTWKNPSAGLIPSRDAAGSSPAAERQFSPKGPVEDSADTVDSDEAVAESDTSVARNQRRGAGLSVRRGSRCG